ncbi:MAG: hypothetical protein JEZ08_18020 [Clostridiales bacterium]|nr:hypothetical protein [Clostridiales bacterium]
MKFKIGIMMIMILMTFSPLVFGETEVVDVTVVEFDIYVNDTEILTEESQYPALVYNNITYFPLTSDYLSTLGLDLTFSNSQGLTIGKKSAKRNLDQRFLGSKNLIGSTVKARLAEFDISVNGEMVNNDEEAHPVLLYKNVTYFPMTWRFAVEEFGWGLSWSSVTGLKITTMNGETVEEVIVPEIEEEVTVYQDTVEALEKRFSDAEFGGKSFDVESITIEEEETTLHVIANVENESLTSVLNITLFKREQLTAYLKKVASDMNKLSDHDVLVELRYDDDYEAGVTELDSYQAAKDYITLDENGNDIVSFSIMTYEIRDSKEKDKVTIWITN